MFSRKSAPPLANSTPLVPPSEVTTSPRRNTLSAGPAAIVIALCPGSAEIPAKIPSAARIVTGIVIVTTSYGAESSTTTSPPGSVLSSAAVRLRQGAVGAHRLLASLPVDLTNVRCATT